MNFDDERFVKVYTRDTDTWRCIAFESRSVLLHLFRVVDRAGILETKRGARGVAAIINAPLETVEHALVELVAEGCVQEHARGYLVPRFVEAQEARQSDRLRAEKSRHRRRERMEAGESLDVSHDVPAESQNVTDRHTRSPQVTKEENREEEKEEKSKSAGRAPSAVEQLAIELAEVACEAINRLAGTKHRPATKATLAACRSLAKAKRSSEDVRAVVAAKAREWLASDKMRPHFNPGTLLRPTNFERYLADLAAAAPSPERRMTARDDEQVVFSSGAVYSVPKGLS